MASPYQGGQALGEAIFGGRRNGVESDVFLDRVRLNHSVKKSEFDAARAMEEAGLSRVLRIAHESIKAADIEAAQSGDKAAQARLGEAVLRSSRNPNLRNITGGFADFDAAGYRRAAVERATLGDMAGANAQLVGLATGPLKVNAIDGGYQLNPYEVGGAAVATPGELANVALRQARVGTEGARQGELGARAELSRVKAAAGGFAPSRTGGRGKELSPAEAATKQQWILAQANKKIADGEPAEFVEAWIANEMVKAGMEPEPAVDVAPPTSMRWIEGGEETVVPLGQVAAAKAPAREAEAAQALKDARAAIATGRITTEEARKRLVAAGFKNVAARL